MRRYISVIPFVIIFCILAGLAAEASAAPPRPRKKSVLLESDGFLSFGAGYLDGDTTYRMDIYDPSSGGAVESELRFPLGSFLMGLEAGYITKDKKARDAWKMSVSYATNVGGSRGKLEDSDWYNDVVDTALVGSPHPGKDIYSESTVDMTARILDLRITRSWWLSDTLAVGPLAGYLYQNFDFTARDVHQVGYGPYASFGGSVSGDVLIYNVIYEIPYAGVHAELSRLGRFRTMFDLSYSPWVKAKDEDDHVLRTKKTRGETSGSAWLAALAGQWDLEDNNLITIRGEYRKIETTGWQSQYWYGNADAPNAYAGDTFSGINDRITSNQYSLILLATSRF